MVARCVKCGATLRDGCDCWVTLRCGKCGKTRRVERDKTDPPQTAEVHVLCPECVGGDFDEPTYFDRHGEQILEF